MSKSKPTNSRLNKKRISKAPKSVQVAFDADEATREAVRKAAYENNLSMPDQVRLILELPVATPSKRPRLTASLTDDDFVSLATRFGLKPEQKAEIKSRVSDEVLRFAKKTGNA